MEELTEDIIERQKQLALRTLQKNSQDIPGVIPSIMVKKEHILYLLDHNNRRKKFMDEMLEKISRYPNGTFLRISWEEGRLIIEGEIDTVYETDNGLDEDDDKYQEFYACTVIVKKVINNSIDKTVNTGDLVEVAIENSPTSIELGDGTLIWGKSC